MIYDQKMNDQTPQAPPEPDAALVEAMRSRVVRRRPAPYGNRKAGPGRPKGTPKTGGRKTGTPNLMSAEFRQWLSERARPFELLAAICAGEEIEDGGQARKPTLSERMRAAETIARKLVPDMAATTLNGANGGPVALTPSDVSAGWSDLELARHVAFLLAKGIHSAENARVQPSEVLRCHTGSPLRLPASRYR